MRPLAAAERADQRGDVGREGGSIIEAVARNLARWIAAQVRRDGAIASCPECRHLVAPGMGRIRKAVQEEDEWTLALLEISEIESVRADAVHKTPNLDAGETASA